MERLASADSFNEAFLAFKQSLDKTIQPEEIIFQSKQYRRKKFMLYSELKREEQTIFIAASHKKSGEKYSEVDIQFFNHAISILQLAIVKIEKIEHIQSFNKRLENEIAAATEELRTLDEAKDTLIQVATHQLKSPVAATIQSLELIEGDQNAELVQLAKDSSNRAKELVDELTTVTEVTLGKLQIDRRKTNIESLTKKRIDIARTTARNKDIQIKLQSELKTKNIAIDAHKIREAIANILDNAIKYSPTKSTITVTINQTAKKLTFCVSDTGAGIPQKDQAKIFNKFYRASNAKNMEDGTGLGLFLAKAVVEAHSGTMIPVSYTHLTLPTTPYV